MHRILLVAPVALLTAAAVSQVSNAPTADQPGIHRHVLVDQQTVQAVRATYEPGAVEPRGPHAFDVLLIPLNNGKVKLNIAGRPDPEWRTGEAIFIKRGTDHYLANVGKNSVRFISVRIP